MLNSSDHEEGDIEELPVKISPYPLQTGGHVYDQGKVTGISLHEDGSILKPVMAPPRGERELGFYRMIFKEKTEPVVVNLRAFIPEFLGVLKASMSGQSTTFLKLENLTSRFRKPCIMDVKIGFRTYDPESTPEKTERAQKKYLTTPKLGFCIPGIKVYDPVSGKYTEYDKVFGKALTVNNIKNALICYLGGHDKLNAKALQSFLHQLQAIQKWFLGQQKFVFYSSSLLFIYDGVSNETLEHSNCAIVNSNAVQYNCGETLYSRRNNKSLSGNDRIKSSTLNSCSDMNGDRATTKDAERREVLTDLRMIDFAHVFPTQELDANYLGGLNNLIKMLREIADDFAQ